MKKLILLLLLYSAFNTILFAQTDYYVDPLGSNGNTGGIGDPWLTIQYAIDNAASGDIIHVAAGTYTEDLLIPGGKTDLEIIGAGVGSSIIQGITQVPFASWPLADPNIEILGDGTILHGFTIKNPTWVNGFYSSGMVIGAMNVEIYDNEFQVAGSDDTDDISQGIQTVFNVDISGLNIHDNDFTHEAVSTAGYEGIYINYNSGAGTVTIDNNTFTGNILRAITTEASNTTISNNSITTDLTAGLPGGYQGININYALGSGTVSSITVTDNTVTGTSGGGFLYAINFGLGSDNNTFTAISITNNDLSGNDTGIRVREDDDQVTITGNDLSSNSTFGVNNVDPTPTTLNAEANWWGDVTGPFNATTNASGLGSPVSDNVDYSPWYGATPGTSPMTYYGDPDDPDYIQDAINNAQDGDEIIIEAGTYNAFTINNEVTLTAEPGVYVNNGSPAITVAANNVTLDGFTFSYGTADYAIQIDFDYSGTVIVNCNFDVINAVDNQSSNSVLAEYNYWGFNGDISGPTISSNPSGTGGVINENPGTVDYDPWVGKNTTPTDGFIGTAISGLSVTWDWPNFFGPDFDFELDHGGLQGEDVSTTVVGTNTYVIPITLDYNTTYNWYVRSTNDPLANWIGPFSFTTTVDDFVLIYPADGAEGLPTSITFTWGVAAGADEYQIQVDDDPAFGSPIIQDVTGGATSYLGAGLATGTTYFWRIRASNNGGTTWGPWTGAFEFMTDFLVSVGLPLQTNYAVGISVLPTFTWLAVAGATSYDIEVDTDPAFGSPESLTGSTTIAGLTYTITEFEQLNSGILYYWRVKVNGGTSDGKYSAVWEFTTHIGTLTITTYYPYGTSASIAWLLLPYTANVKYDLYYSDDSFLTYSSVTNLTNTYYTLTGLDPGTTYEVLVRAKNNAGTVIIAYSSIVTFTTEGLPTPYLSYPIGGVTTYYNPPYLYWYTGTLFAGQYQVRYSDDPSVDVDGMLDVGATNLALTSNLYTVFPVALTAGETYYWQVRCYDGTNYGDWSVVESFVIYSSTPTTPVVPYLSYPTGGSIVYINPPTFYWYTGTYTTGLEFYVEWDDDSDLDVAPLGNSGWISDLYFTLPSNLTSGTDYWWRVKSRLADPPNTESAWSTVETFEMSSSLAGGADQPYPSSPVGTSILTLTPTLSWTIFTTQTLEYQVRISPYSSTDGTGMLDHVTAVSSGWVSSTSIGVGSIPFTLVPGATYYWQVRSRLTATPATMSSWSYVVYFQTAAGALSVVPLIGSPNYGQPINNTSALLSWIIPTQSQSHLVYQLEYSKYQDFTNAVVISGINEPFAKIDGLEQNTKYYWRVSSSTNNGSQSMYSETGTFSTSSITDVEEVKIPTELILEQNYPNPFNPTTRITYSLPENSFVSLKIYDILGREVSTLVNSEIIAGTHTVEWNGTDSYGNKVASGTYIYRLISGNFSSTKKMILIK